MFWLPREQAERNPAARENLLAKKFRCCQLRVNLGVAKIVNAGASGWRANSGSYRQADEGPSQWALQASWRKDFSWVE